MNYVILKKDHAVFANKLWIIIFLLAIGNFSCKQSSPNKTTDKIKPVIIKHNLEADLIAYVDSAAHLFNQQKHADSALYQLTKQFTGILPLHLYKFGKESPDSTLAISIISANKTTGETLDISIPRELENKLEFKAFTDHFGIPDIKDKMFDEFKSPLPATINLNKFLRRSDSVIKLYITSQHSSAVPKNKVYRITLSKWSEKQ